MASEPTVEERLAALEAEVAELKRLPPRPDWVGRVVGSMRGEPAFEEILAFGREYRASQSAPDGADGAEGNPPEGTR